MPYLVIHQNPVKDQYIRNNNCGDIVIFHVNKPVEYTRYEIPIEYPEYDPKLVIDNTEIRVYMQEIGFGYDPVDDMNFLCETRWCEAERIKYFDYFVEMYDHIYVSREYTVFHHMNTDQTIQYFYKEKIDQSMTLSSI